MVDETVNGPPVVEMRAISKRFGTVSALEGVDFEVRRGEVCALLGDNGAGKSTLIKILTGIYPATSGEIRMNGAPVHIRTPADARALGIETVYQDLALVNLMSVTRNFFLGREVIGGVGPLRFMRLGEMNARTEQALLEIGIEKFSTGRSVTEPVAKLSGGERQSIAIGRAVHFGASLLILDEPTSALSVGETEKVLHYTLRAKERGMAVIFISHNLHHVSKVADRYTIIRHGRKVGDYPGGSLTESDLGSIITGERER